MTIRTLVLSGGGGRGAFHAGVYLYLSERDKQGVDAAHRDVWTPDIVVGTSIGAVNGAAIVQGMSADELKQRWLALREHDIQGLPPGMGWLARRVANVILRHAIGTGLKPVPREIALSPEASDTWPPLPILPRWLSRRLVGRWNNLLDTGPLYRTLIDGWGIDTDKLSASDMLLLISATNVQTGEGAVFSNRPIAHSRTGDDVVRTPITPRRIIASCSIPLVYPWTVDTDDPEGEHVYWDGAVVANTPLGPAFDAVRGRPIDEEMEAVVVMMTPWVQEGEGMAVPMPNDFGEAITITLDWALLASFRADLKITRMYNRMAEMEMEAGRPQPYRMVRDVIVAPDHLLPVTRIVDYDEKSADLIDLGYAAAKRAFEAHFAGSDE